MAQQGQGDQADNADQTGKPASQAKAASTGTKTKLYPGNDQLFKRDLAPPKDPVLARGDRVSLNFENVSVAGLAQALLGDLLKLNYTVDAGGDTVVSLRTSQPLLRSQVLDVLDTVLLPHDLAIVRDNVGVYHVTKRAVTVGARPVVGASKFKDLAGSGTVIVPLNYIAAAEMAKILAPLAPREAIVYVDSLRNLLVLQGSKSQLAGWLEMVEAFDVDFLAGMSLGVFVLENANVNVVRDALQAMLGAGGDKAADPYGSSAGAASAPASGAAGATGGGSPGASAGAQAAAAGSPASGAGPLSGLIRVFPVERLNALVVVTPRSHLLPQVESWIRRLDRPTDTLEPHLFVYPVQNGSAVHLAEMLNGLFGGGGAAAARPGVAAGSAPAQFAAATSAQGTQPSMATSMTSTVSTGMAQTGGLTGSSLGASQGTMARPGGGAATGPQLSTVSQLEGNVRVVADDKRNALLIRAPRAEYRRIEQALRELDKAPAQVLIEASIVEVSLTGNLKYGVEWFIQNSLSGDRTGQALLNMNNSGSIGPQQPGFSYTILNKAGAVRATLNALAANSQLRVLSNPSVLVLDNHSATILVGKQQPIKQSTTVTTGNLVTESIVYKDTGVMLSVTPSVNAGGLVTLDINQQVTDVGDVDQPTGQRTFLTRQIQSRVAVRSGDPIVLGGVMSENQSTGNSGVPGLRDVPVLGALFSTDTTTSARTELLVVLTPRALEDDDALRAASAEMRDRMRTMSLQGLLVPASAAKPPEGGAPLKPESPQ
ncbi:type II secretion system secretin GspD [Alicycliphilus denitrificans]|uniref:type II secretion system secretin GspD n=1 Tax=Alicycliphilus denitrificans TaxID=179636 RepID=UPI003A800342